VLARKATAIRRRACVGSWLYQVAYHAALRARAGAARRRGREQQGVDMAAVRDRDPLTVDEARAALDEELRRLAETYRAPLVLCYLEGKTQDEAAAHLGWSKGTLRRRLEHGRKLLHARLTRRGIALGTVLATTALGVDPAAAVPPALAASAVNAASQVTARGTFAADGVSPHVLALANGLTRAMSAGRGKLLGVLLLVLAALAAGAGALAQPQRQEPQAE